jgi:hypothetical protein
MPRRLGVLAGSAVLVAAGLGVVACGGDVPAARAPSTTAAPAPPPATTPEPAPEPRTLVLVRRRGGLPGRWVDRLRRSDDVDAVAEVSRTQWLLRRSATRGGRPVDAARPGYAIPLDAMVVDPHAYARALEGDERAAMRAVRGGRVVLSASSARLRRLGEGGRLTLAGGRTVRVAGVVPDDLARGAELIVAAADVPAAARRNAQVVVATREPEAVERLVPDDRLTRIGILARDRAATTAPGRGGIVRPLELKRRFGESAVRLPFGADWITIDPAWVDRMIVTRRVPILGNVTCHRELIAPLRRGLRTLQRRGLSRLIDPGDYAGCYAPRRIPGSGSLSLHAWGLAFDVNASENPFGAEPKLDRRVVAAFEAEGFTWGGRWPTATDGMHFELQR